MGIAEILAKVKLATFLVHTVYSLANNLINRKNLRQNTIKLSKNEKLFTKTAAKNFQKL